MFSDNVSAIATPHGKGGISIIRISGKNPLEIAEKMFLSEGSVKQYVKQIYSKLQIEGDTRTKRKQLLQLLEENS